MPVSRRTVLIASATAVVLAACDAKGRGGQAVASSTTSGAPTSAGSTTEAPPAATTSTTGASGGPSTFVNHGPRTTPAAALTFHANGDAVLAARLLDVLKALGAPATFFAVGAMADAHPSFITRLLAEGHELANHTYTHPDLGTLKQSAVAAEITRCRDSLTHHAGQPGHWFRPSGIDTPTALMLTEAGKAGYATTVGYDLDPHDYQDPGRAVVEQRVSAGLQPGSIVSLHTGHQGTIDALPAIVAAATAKGLTLVAVSRLLA